MVNNLDDRFYRLMNEWKQVADRRKELLREVLYLHSDFQSVPNGTLEKLLKAIEKELADD